MRQVREVLRLHCAAGMKKCIRRAGAQGLGWPLPDSPDDAGLKQRPFPAPRAKPRPLPLRQTVQR